MLGGREGDDKLNLSLWSLGRKSDIQKPLKGQDWALGGIRTGAVESRPPCQPAAFDFLASVSGVELRSRRQHFEFALLSPRHPVRTCRGR